MLSGCAAIWFAFHFGSDFGPLSALQWCWICIGVAAVFDFCDGFSARMLKAYSPVGKELDSLSDLVSFGLAPAFMVMNMMDALGSAWAPSLAALLIAVLGALRLAKFNVDTRQSTSFIGLPIPANAIFWIGASAWVMRYGYPGPVVTICVIAFVSMLMVSEMPMFSLKFQSYGFKENVRRYTVMAAAVLFVATGGIPGLMWTIVLYILICRFGRRTDPSVQS